ncbi:MAG: FecCD family ABC transporter permease [Candidatus Heteroscillospira sp.]|jgi:iron complex transport system permease protein
MRHESTLLKSAAAKKRTILLSLFLLLSVMVVSVTLGNLRIPLSEVGSVFGEKLGLALAGEGRYTTIVWDVRLPRIWLAALTGAALAVAGTVFQGVFRNPLVEPYILGVSSGAACGAAIAIVFLQTIVPVSVMAFIFAVGAMLMAYGVATSRGETPLVNLILSGVIVGSVFTAILNLVKTIAPDSKLREISFWLMGGFYTAKWSDVRFLAVCVFVSVGILWALGWQLNVLTMGEQEARTMGIRVGLLKLTALGTATFITAAAVANVGIISWVGLMVPHACRMILGADHRYTIPFSACLGAMFLVVCDTIARTAIMGEIPVSIITSILGAPYLIYLLRTNRQVGME